MIILFRDEATMSLEVTLKAHFNSFPGYLSMEDIESCNFINVRRKHIWDDTLRAFSKPSFDPLNLIRVTFVSEAAIDEGGPRREFFTLGLSKVAEDPRLFCDPATTRLFTHNLQGLRNQTYYKVGMFLALSLANGGPGMD